MNSNPVHNRRRLARRIWKSFQTGFYNAVIIDYGVNKEYRRVAILNNGKTARIEVHDIDNNVTVLNISNLYEYIIEQIRRAEDIKCFGRKYQVDEWNALNYMKAYTYLKLGWCGNSCYVIA